MTALAPISPELALVDPDLAEALRETLHAPGQFVPAWRDPPKPLLRVAPPPAPAVAAPAAAELPAVAIGAQRVHPLRRKAALVAAGAGAVVVGLVTGLDRPVRHHGAPAVTTARAAELHARAIQQTRDAGKLEWPTVPNVKTYRAELRRGSTTVYSVVTRSSKLTPPLDLALEPGTYRWTVTPLRKQGEARPVVEVSFVVNPS